MQKRHSILNKIAGRIAVVAMFALLIIAFSCQHSKSQPNDSSAASPDSGSKKEAPAILPKTGPDSLSGITGTYACKCLAGNNQIDLQLKKNKDGLHVNLEYKAGGFRASGILHPDTVNFDKEFKVWSFTYGKKVYGFNFTRDDHNEWTASLINEDYKKELNSCSDAKVIDFTKH